MPPPPQTWLSLHLISQERVDPINLQLYARRAARARALLGDEAEAPSSSRALSRYAPHLRGAVRACSEQSQLFHLQLFGAQPRAAGPDAAADENGGPGAVDLASVGTNVLALARPAQRFPLLPLPLDELAAELPAAAAPTAASSGAAQDAGGSKMGLSFLTGFAGWRG